MDRRDFLRYSCASAVTLAVPWCPLEAQARGISLTDILKINAVRFIGGLIWDAVAPVLLKTVSNGIDWLLCRSSSRSWRTSYYSYPPTNEIMQPQEYRASVVVYGIADYQLSRKRDDFLVKLRTEDESKRFVTLREYMADNRIRVSSVHDKPEDGGRSHRVSNKTSLDEMLSIGYIDYTDALDKEPSTHYLAMENITGATVFKNWHA